MRASTRLAAALTLLLVVSAPVAAKGDYEARLDAPIPIVGDPGATISVGFVVESTYDGGDFMEGSPMFLRVHPIGGAPVEATADPDGAGHYTAQFVMPAHGIAMVEIGLFGEQCEHGTCWRSDLLFRVIGPGPGPAYLALPTARPAPAPAAMPVATSAPAVAPAPGGASPSPDRSWIPVAAAAALMTTGIAFGGLAPRRGRTRTA
jgi:hypothetical protein